jgi:magnesium-protoporphyrin IX monomethyl ester (oxidative) cyclase
VTDASAIRGDIGVLFGLPLLHQGSVESGYTVEKVAVELFRLADGHRSFEDILRLGELRLGLPRDAATRLFMAFEDFDLVYGLPQRLVEPKDRLEPRSLRRFRKQVDRIAFVIPPPAIRAVRTDRQVLLSNSAPPLGVLGMAAVLEADGFDVAVFDLSHAFGGWDAFLRELERFAPGFVGLSLLSTQVLWGREIIRTVRDHLPDVMIVAGGVHPTVCPEEMLTAGADAVVLGEGELALPRLLRAVQRGEVHAVTGIAHSELPAGTPAAPPDVATLPPAARHLVDIRSYYHAGSLMTSRGCSNACFWCTNIFKRLRERPIENVFGEMVGMESRWGIRGFEIQDDLFTSRPERVRRFCELVRPRGYEWGAHATIADAARDPSMFAEMKEAGLRALLFGVETADGFPAAREGKSLASDRTREVLLRLRELGLRVSASFILGLPQDTRESVARTREFAIELQREGIEVFANVLTAFPGTPLYLHPDRYGVQIEDARPNRLAYRCVNLRTRNLSSAAIREEYSETLLALASNEDPTGLLRLTGEK